MADKQKKINEEGATPAADTLKTKSAMMTGVLQAMSAMNHEQMMQWFDDAMALAGGVPDGAAAQNQGSLQMKPSAAAPVQEDVKELFSGDDLTEEAQDRILTLVEHAVSTQVAIEKVRLEEEFETRLVEETAAIQEQMVEKIDHYVTYAAEQWVEKNELEIESSVKVARAERLLSGLANLMAECYVEIPEEKEGILESLQSQVDELKGKLDEAVEDSVTLREELTATRAMSIFREVSEGLADTEVEKFKKLVEDLEVDIDPNSLRQKLRIIREAHFRKSRKVEAEKLAEGLTEEQVSPVEETTLVEERHADPRVNRYADAISRASAASRWGTSVKTRS